MASLNPASHWRRAPSLAGIMTAQPDEMVTISRAELEALRAENRRLRLEAGGAEALRRIQDGPGSGGRTFTRDELAEAWGISE